MNSRKLVTFDWAIKRLLYSPYLFFIKINDKSIESDPIDQIELKQTRFYQEVVEEGRQEGRQEECIALVTRLLRRKFGIRLELEQSLGQLQTLPVEKLEGLTEAIFDWTEIGDLTEWLRQQLV